MAAAASSVSTTVSGAVTSGTDTLDGLQGCRVDGDVRCLGGRSVSGSVCGVLSLSSLSRSGQLDGLLSIGIVSGCGQRSRLGYLFND